MFNIDKMFVSSDKNLVFDVKTSTHENLTGKIVFVSVDFFDNKTKRVRNLKYDEIRVKHLSINVH